MTLVERKPTPRRITRLQRKIGTSPARVIVPPRPQLPVERQVKPLYTRYCVAPEWSDTAPASILIQALTLGKWLERALDVTLAACGVLGVGWLMRRARYASMLSR